VIVIIEVIKKVIHFRLTLFVMLLFILIIILYTSYFLFSKRKLIPTLKENKDIDYKKVVVIIIFIFYITMLIDYTLLNRGINTSNINLNLMSSYKHAWYNISKSGYKHIILNIVMTVPLGVLLPLLHNKFRKFVCVIATGFLIILSIEFIQLITTFGVFDVDDIFNNIIGLLIGFGVAMGILIFTEKKLCSNLIILKYFSPLIITVLIFIIIFAYYNYKDLGNLPISIYTMKNTNIVLNTELNNKRVIVPLYQAPIFDKDSSRNFAINFLNKFHINTEELLCTYDSNYISFISKDGLNIFRLNLYNGIYRYLNYTNQYMSKTNEVKEISKEEICLPSKAECKESLLRKLGGLGIFIPEEAEFELVEHCNYIFRVEQFINGNILTDGFLSCLFNSDGSIRLIHNNLISYTRLRDVYIISEEEAFQRIKYGKINIYVEIPNAELILINKVRLSYQIDSKGFFQPIYIFDSVANDYEFEIIVQGIITSN